jgi:SAM-dependent methyltransferase
MGISYIHNDDVHSLAGPGAALPVLLGNTKPSSLLDVGCGNGTWLKAAVEFGIPEVFGVDGVKVSPEKLHIPAEQIRHQDLTHPWNLGKRFDVVICLEVAEHLDSAFAEILIDALVKHGDRIYFSAACPGQIGHWHVNCQWPSYWQKLFNDRGYVCEDGPRWQIWGDSRIEPWYRQNLFLARRVPEMAGQEPRIRAVIHPGVWKILADIPRPTFEEHVHEIEQGRMPVIWNLTIPARALWAKLVRRLKNPPERKD